MNKTPFISVIVPFFNNSGTIEKCVKSILDQTFEDFEFILVNDGSTDKSETIVNRFGKVDSRIRIIKQENNGVSVARNTGIELSSGEYITFCDADDFYGKEWLQNLCREIDDNDIVFANYINIDENGKTIKETLFSNGRYQLNNEEEHLNFIIHQVFQKGCSWTVWSCLFKRRIIMDNHIRFNTKCDDFAEDLGFVLEYLLHSNNVKISQENSYYYVTHLGSMSDRNNDVVRMDPLNEVSKGFYMRSNEIGYKGYDKTLAIIHFLIMYGQYYKMINKPTYSKLGQEIDKINDKQYYYKMVKKLLSSYKELCKYTDKKTAKQILLFSNYCVHGNWERFKIESAIFYKVIK